MYKKNVNEVQTNTEIMVLQRPILIWVEKIIIFLSIF